MNAVTEQMDQLLNRLEGVSDIPLPAGGIDTLRAFLHAPPRVLVAGRVSSGKSTLVNALVGTHVAETSPLESTAEVTVYSYGSPDRTQIRERAVHRSLTIGRLKELAVVDTPGLSTVTTEYAHAARNALDGDKPHFDTHADAVVFLGDGLLRADEREALAQWPFTDLNAVACIGRSDTYGAGPFADEDPIDAARTRAMDLRAELGGQFGAVYAVSGLLAQAATTGSLTEGDARALRALADVPRWELFDRIDALDADRSDRRLLDLCGPYGMIRGAHPAANGVGVLIDWCGERSGIAQLRTDLRDRAQRHAPLVRAEAILQLMRHGAAAAADPERVRQALFDTTAQPTMLPVRLFVDYQRLGGAGNEGLRRMAATMLGGDTTASRVGLLDGAAPADIVSAADRLLDEVARLNLFGGTVAENGILATLTQCYRHIIREESR